MQPGADQSNVLRTTRRCRPRPTWWMLTLVVTCELVAQNTNKNKMLKDTETQTFKRDLAGCSSWTQRNGELRAQLRTEMHCWTIRTTIASKRRTQETQRR